jgi:hypothetical protein
VKVDKNELDQFIKDNGFVAWFETSAMNNTNIGMTFYLLVVIIVVVPVIIVLIVLRILGSSLSLVLTSR